jgi:acyl-CoA hydrolase/GNAT superfamily N-acetyltransferase
MGKMTTEYKNRLISAEEAIKKIRSGNRIFIGSGSAAPLLLIETLSQSIGSRIDDAEVVHLFLTQGLPYVEACLLGRFRLMTFHVGSGIDQTAAESCADFIPMFHSQIPGLFRSGRFRIDVALIQVSPPDTHGYLNMGAGVDITRAAIASAKTVIAEINPAVPRTFGNTQLRLDEVDFLVNGYDKLLELEPAASDDVSDRIGGHTAKLIEDGSCIQTGFDVIPRAVLKHLKDKNDLGVHTEMFSDGLIPLIQAGNVNNSRKQINTNKCVASFCMGTRNLFDFVSDNPAFDFQPTDYTNNPYIIGRNDSVVAIIEASCIDLTGQVAYSGAVKGSFGGFGGDSDFIKGAAQSRGGRAIITLRSTGEDGAVSNIVSSLKQSSGVAASRADIQYVVTEFGIANLYGKCIRDRAMSLIGIAHPAFREALIDEAKELGYIYRDQVFNKKGAYLYPDDLEVSKTFKGGVEVLFRPIKPDDEPLMKQLFYDFSPKSIYHRYFTQLKSMPHSKLQRYLSVDYQNAVSIVGVVGGLDNERIIAEGRYLLEESRRYAEVAFTVDEDYQNIGISSFLCKYLADVAKDWDVRGFTAYVLKENVAMLKVFQKLYPDLKMKLDEPGVYLVTMDFQTAST